MSEKYPLEERTTIFSEKSIAFLKKVNPSTINTPLISQLVRSATSIGANYMEANNASSRKDFQNKIYICKKEAQETKYWFTLLTKADPSIKGDAIELLDEVQQLILIFQKIISTMKTGN